MNLTNHSLVFFQIDQSQVGIIGSPEWQAYKNAELAHIAPSVGPLAAQVSQPIRIKYFININNQWPIRIKNFDVSININDQSSILLFSGSEPCSTTAGLGTTKSDSHSKCSQLCGQWSWSQEETGGLSLRDIDTLVDIHYYVVAIWGHFLSEYPPVY